MNALPVTSTARPSRIASIDAIRGIAMLLMLVDHTREFFYTQYPVSDPMDLAATPQALVLTRLTAHLCAPVFVLLTGLSAWLYGAGKGGAGAASAFLFKRGLFLVVLELTVITFAWSFDLTPQTYFLQVIWAIGLAMIALSALVPLPRAVLVGVAVVIIAAHNLLDGIHVPAGQPGHVIWAIVHDRGYIDLPWDARARTSYPILPWIGIIALGYAIGPWFGRDVPPARRRKLLLISGIAALAAFVILRSLNGYGDPAHWRVEADLLSTGLSFMNLTKYPPSLLFSLATLGIGLLLLVALDERAGPVTAVLAVFGGAPLFFYIAHLYLLHTLNLFVPTLPNVGAIWLLSIVLAIPSWFACRAFARAKRRYDIWWLKYL